MFDHVAVQLELNGRRLDLGVPSGVCLVRMREIVARVLADNGVVMPKRWGLRLMGKPVVIGGFDVCGEYPVGDNDVLQVVVDGDSV